MISLFVMKALHHEKLPVHRIVELVNQRRCLGNSGIRKQDVPARLFSLYPFLYPLAIVFSGEVGDLLNESSQPLRKRPVVRDFASVVDEKDATKLSPQRLADGFGHTLDLGRQLECSV